MTTLAEFQMYFMYLEQEKDREIRATLEKKLNTTAKTITRDGKLDAYNNLNKIYGVNDANKYFARDMERGF